MRVSLLATLATLIVTVFGSQALAQDRGMTLEELRRAFAVAGGETVQTEDCLVGEIDGMKYSIEGLNCEAGRCTEFLFLILFELKEAFSLEKINEWNRTRFFGRAFLDDEGQPGLDHAFSVSSADDLGVVAESLSLWEATVILFSEYIDLPVAAGEA